MLKKQMVVFLREAFESYYLLISKLKKCDSDEENLFVLDIRADMYEDVYYISVENMRGTFLLDLKNKPPNDIFWIRDPMYNFLIKMVLPDEDRILLFNLFAKVIERYE